MSTDLNTPLVEGGLQRIPFFNGRVLTAEDLETEQDANATERRRLGRALGTGVVKGLSVRLGSDDPPTTVVVESGLALAPSGRVVELPRRTTVSVVSEAEREESAGTGQFEACSAQHATVKSGTGAYLLVVEPASDTSGHVPRTRLGGNGAAGECGAQYRLEGGRLCLAGFNPSDSTLVHPTLGQAVRQRAAEVIEARDSGNEPDVEDLSLLRNLLAHSCLGTATTAGRGMSLVDAFRGRTEERVTYGPVDGLRRNGDLSEDAVPIALLYWSHDRIEFVDIWAVRRPVHRRGPQALNPATDRRRAEAEAAVFQFHDHLAALREDDLRVRQRPAEQLFAYLPPIGMIGEVESLVRPVERERLFGIPIRGEGSRYAPLRAGFTERVENQPSGVPRLRTELPEVPSFFDGLTVGGPTFVEPQRLRALIEEVLEYPPLSIDSAFSPDPREPDEAGPLVWVYLLAPNVTQDEEETPFLFTTGYAPFFGDAQFNISRANQATFSSESGPPGGS